MKKTDTLPFTWESLQKELDGYRERKKGVMNITEDQKDFILKCRDNDRPVPYPQMVMLWEKLGWGNISRCPLRDYYNALKSK